MYYFIINPNARSRKGIQVWKYLKKMLLEQKVRFREFITKGPGDAIKISEKISSLGYQVKMVALGGDGTLHEVLTGIVNMEHVSLGYIPIGSSNDFARGMKWKESTKERLEHILAGADSYHIDYGVVKSQQDIGRFAVSAGVGFDAAVCEMANHSKSKKLLNGLKMGKLTYVQIGLRALWSAKMFSAFIVLDEKEEIFLEQLLFLSVHNLPFEGGGIPFCPTAEPQDGYLNVCIAAGIAKKRFPGLLIKAMKGNHTQGEGIYMYQCKKIVLRLSSAQFLHMDGEVPGKVTEIEISVSDDQVHII